MQTFLKAPAAFTYVGLFMMLYFISSFIRRYPKKIFRDKKIWMYMTIFSLIASWCSVLFCAWIYQLTGKRVYYYFVADSNKLLAVLTAVSVFLLFLNFKIKSNHFINKTAASAFGVLMIHANSDAMRQWLWQDVFRNTWAFQHKWFIFHAVGSVCMVYFSCTLLDMLRIKFLEKPFLPKMVRICERMMDWGKKKVLIWMDFIR